MSALSRCDCLGPEAFGLRNIEETLYNFTNVRNTLQPPSELVRTPFLHLLLNQATAPTLRFIITRVNSTRKALCSAPHCLVSNKVVRRPGD
jgi:hypothetical protein